MNGDKKNPCPAASAASWYAAGLHFECLKCGRCCSGPAQGYIWVSRPEIKAISGYLNVPAGELKKEFLMRVGLRMTIIEDAVTRDCIFLKTNGSTGLTAGDAGKECMIYPVRPSQCRTWPFWPGNLASPNCWNTSGRKCPGINRGTFYGLEQIESIRNNGRNQKSRFIGIEHRTWKSEPRNSKRRRAKAPQATR